MDENHPAFCKRVEDRKHLAFRVVAQSPVSCSLVGKGLFLRLHSDEGHNTFEEPAYRQTFPRAGHADSQKMGLGKLGNRMPEPSPPKAGVSSREIVFCDSLCLVVGEKSPPSPVRVG